MVVDNRGGANGNMAGQLVARGPADGSSLLLQYSGYQCITPLLQPVSGFDPGKDLTKTYMVHISYQGTGQALTELLDGTVSFTLTTPPQLLAHIRPDKLHVLKVTGSTRFAVPPNVPTTTEQGVPLGGVAVVCGVRLQRPACQNAGLHLGGHSAGRGIRGLQETGLDNPMGRSRTASEPFFMQNRLPVQAPSALIAIK